MKKSTLVIGGAIAGVIAVAALSSCKTIPRGAVAVKPFDSRKRAIGYDTTRLVWVEQSKK